MKRPKQKLAALQGEATLAVSDEIKWRYDLLAEIGGKAVNYAVNPATLREWRIYGGAQGM